MSIAAGATPRRGDGFSQSHGGTEMRHEKMRKMQCKEASARALAFLSLFVFVVTLWST